MKKKLLAAAVATAFAAPVAAFAQSTVTIGGTLYLEYSFADYGPANNAARTDLGNIDQLQTPGSELVLRGEEKLGGGMSAWFQCASTFDVRGASPQGFCGRNSAIGLRGSYGNVFVGNWDTPFKRVAAANRIVQETGTWGASFLLLGGASTYEGRADPQSFARRASNSISYESPSLGGFQVMLMTTALGTNSTPTTNPITGATQFTPGAISSLLTTAPVGSKNRLTSIGATYTAGPLNLTAGYEEHKNFWNGATTAVGVAPVAFTGTDKGYVLSAGYTIGPVKLGLIYANMKFEPTAATNSKVSTYNLAADWKITGPGTIRVGYTSAGDVKGNGGAIGAGSRQGARPAAGVDTGADMWQINYVHALSKRTEGTIGYVRLSNDLNANYALGGAIRGGTGGDQSAYGLSIRHRF